MTIAAWAVVATLFVGILTVLITIIRDWRAWTVQEDERARKRWTDALALVRIIEDEDEKPVTRAVARAALERLGLSESDKVLIRECALSWAFTVEYSARKLGSAENLPAATSGAVTDLKQLDLLF